MFLTFRQMENIDIDIYLYIIVSNNFWTQLYRKRVYNRRIHLGFNSFNIVTLSQWADKFKTPVKVLPQKIA